MSTNSNIFTGTRKLVGGKKSSKKSSKNSSKKANKPVEQEVESDDDSSVSPGMLALLEDDSNDMHQPENNTNQSNTNQANNMAQANMEGIDPLTIIEQVQTDKQGKQTHNNRIGELLGGSEFSNLANLYSPPTNQFYSPVSTAQNNFQPEYNQLAQSLLSQQMPMQQMPMQQMPMQQMPMQQMYGGGNPFYNLSKLL